VAGRISDTFLSLNDASGAAFDSNDNWMTHPRREELVAYQLAPTDEREAAMVATLQPGSYTAIMRGAGNATGVGLVELYDVQRTAAANAVNLSTRGRVQTGDNVMIAGVIIGGSTTQRVIMRAIGPTLAGSGIAGVLANPTLEIVNASGTRVAFNDNWRSDQQAEISGTGLAPGNDAESAIVQTLSPGNYTAIVRGAGNTSGVGLVEIYRQNP
jgi:hypothetical protein